MYLQVRYQDCQNLYPENNSRLFTVELPTALIGNHLAVTQIYINPETLCVLSADIVDESIYNCSLQPVLGVFFKSGYIPKPAYLKIVEPWVKRIRFTVESEQKINDLYFTLHCK